MPGHIGLPQEQPRDAGQMRPDHRAYRRAAAAQVRRILRCPILEPGPHGLPPSLGYLRVERARHSYCRRAGGLSHRRRRGGGRCLLRRRRSLRTFLCRAVRGAQRSLAARHRRRGPADRVLPARVAQRGRLGSARDGIPDQRGAPRVRADGAGRDGRHARVLDARTARPRRHRHAVEFSVQRAEQEVHAGAHGRQRSGDQALRAHAAVDAIRRRVGAASRSCCPNGTRSTSGLASHWCC